MSYFLYTFSQLMVQYKKSEATSPYALMAAKMKMKEGNII